MSNYVFGAGHSYREYLENKGLQRDLKREISVAARAIVVSNEDLQNRNLNTLQELSTSVTTGFKDVAIHFGHLKTGLHELNATFEWGFSELLTQTSRINDSLEELVRLAKTPAQTWAYEQFDIARDADRKGLYEEAIEYLERAINGNGSQTGYKLEYRFHFLLGRVRLGSFKNHSDGIIDLVGAERSFLLAARYATQDAPQEAARALLAAGWAAYSRGNAESAREYTKESVALDPKLAEGHFQLAKLLMHLNDPYAALIPLRSAIELDRGYALKVTSDGDFKPHDRVVAILLNNFRQQAEAHATSSLNAIERKKDALEKTRATKYFLVESLALSKFHSLVQKARNLASENTFYGFLDAARFCLQAEDELARVSKQTQEEHRKRELEIEAKRQGQLNSSQGSFYVSLVSLLCCLLGPIGLVLGISSYKKSKTFTNTPGIAYSISAIIIGAITSVLLIWVVIGLSIGSIK